MNGVDDLVFIGRTFRDMCGGPCVATLEHHADRARGMCQAIDRLLGPGKSDAVMRGMFGEAWPAFQDRRAEPSTLFEESCPPIPDEEYADAD